MRIFQLPDFPKHHYFVETLIEWWTVREWMNDNDIDWIHESSGHQGIGFSVRSKHAWFILRWM